MRRWAAPLIVAALGCGLLALVVPRAHPARRWNVSSDREQSQVRAREISSMMGLDTAGWEATVTGSTNAHAGYAAHPRFSAVYPKVALKAPRGKARILVVLSGAGDFNSWEWRGYPKSPELDAEAARVLATRALARIAGNEAGAFQQLSNPARDGDSRRFAFDRSQPFAQHFEATVNGSNVVKAEWTAVYGGKIDEALNAREKYINWTAGVTGTVVYFAGTLLAFCVYVFWAARRGVRHRFVFAVAGASVVWGAIYWSNWMGYSERYAAVANDVSFAGKFLGAAIIQVLVTGMYFILAGGADAIGVRPKLVTLRSIFTGSLFNRQAGSSILTGILWAPLVCALPLAVSSLRLFGSQQTGNYDAAVIYAAHPAVQVLDTVLGMALLGLFGFGTGFLARYVRKPRVAAGVLAVLGVPVFANLAWPTETGLATILLCGAVLYAAYYALFQRADLLAVLAAGMGVQVIWNASSLILQPAASLQTSGVAALAFLFASAGVAALVARRGRELATDDDAAPAAVTSRREALMKEFSIAHRVQQQMLPEHPPAIPSCTVAASCHPALEVGGDLFDFLQLPDGRWTIGVGDVSGKGLHAALYMTLTKGLLMATTQDSSDLVDIIGNVNAHVHAATEKKSFVTMALGAFDPETRSFDHVRAGHNPIVWRRPAENRTSLLNSPGLGLGIVSDRLFRRSVKMERLQLAAGDALVFYSDGLTEAMNIELEQYGEERLMRVVESADGLDAGGVRERILQGVTEFLGGVTAQDDMTIVVLRVN